MEKRKTENEKRKNGNVCSGGFGTRSWEFMAIHGLFMVCSWRDTFMAGHIHGGTHLHWAPELALICATFPKHKKS